MAELQIWVFGGIVSVAFSIFLILFRAWLAKSEKLAIVIDELRLAIREQSVRIETLFKENDERQRTIEKIETRLSVLEQNQYKK